MKLAVFDVQVGAILIDPASPLKNYGEASPSSSAYGETTPRSALRYEIFALNPLRF